MLANDKNMAWIFFFLNLDSLDKLIKNDIHPRLYPYYKTDKSFALSVYFHICLSRSLSCVKMYENVLVVIYISGRFED